MKTPVLDSYPEHKPMIMALVDTALLHPLNLHIFQFVIQEIIEIIGDDDLHFELQELYEITSSKTLKKEL